MGFDLFFFSVRGRQAFPIQRDIVKELFGPYSDSGRLESSYTFPGGGFCEIIIDDDPNEHSMMIARPPDNPLFWEALFECMRRMPSVLRWPSLGVNSAVVDAAFHAQIYEPDGEGAFQPALVKSATELHDLVFGPD